MSELQELDIRNTPVADAGLVHLAGLTRLQVLHVAGTKVTIAGAKLLKQSLPVCFIPPFEWADYR